MITIMKLLFVVLVALVSFVSSSAIINPNINNATLAPGKIFGFWYCGDDECSWSSEPSLNNIAWVKNRGDSKPTANVVIFSFVDPGVLLNNPNGVPNGMTKNAVSFFTSAGITVFFSIGGASYASKFMNAISTNASAMQLATNAAAVAKNFGVGIEIDLEPDDVTRIVPQLNTFITHFRAIIPYEENGAASTLLTLDAGAGTGWPTGLSAPANNWVKSKQLNWIYAMVASNCEDDRQYWASHISSGLPASNLVVSLWSGDRCSSQSNCQSLATSGLQWATQNGAKGVSWWVISSKSQDREYIVTCPQLEKDSQTFLG